MTETPLSAEEVLRRAHAVGDYYGFVSFAALALAERDKRANVPKQDPPQLSALDKNAEIVANFLRQCRDLGLFTVPRQPLFVWHSNIAPGRPAPKVAHIQFHAIGSDRALADAVVIRAIRALAHDLTKGEVTLRINTLGDKETRARYMRELGNFFKKKGATLPEDCLAVARRDVFEAAELALEKRYVEDLPAPTEFLSDQSRKRFEDVLEYLETTDTPYELSGTLLSRGGAWSETCFSFATADKTLAWGSRYGDLARAFFKSPMPSTGAVLSIETEGTKISPLSAPKSRTKLQFAFVHIGEEAKRESLKIVEELRHARLPLWQIIGLESLTEQMLHVERLAPPYLIVMGRKEALERSVVLRNRTTQEDIVIPLPKLSERLRTFA